MPNIAVQWYAGRTDQQKREIVAAITDAMVKIGKTTADQVHVVFQDVEKSNWGVNGGLARDSSGGGACRRRSLRARVGGAGDGGAGRPPAGWRATASGGGPPGRLHPDRGRPLLPGRPRGGRARRRPRLRLGVDGGASLGHQPLLALAASGAGGLRQPNPAPAAGA